MRSSRGAPAVRQRGRLNCFRRSVVTEKFSVSGVIQGSRRHAKNRFRRGVLRCRKAEAIQFKEQDAGHEAGAFVAVHKGVVPDDADRVRGSQVDDIHIGTVGSPLPWPRRSRLCLLDIAFSISESIAGSDSS
jgi:hypothetical protein